MRGQQAVKKSNSASKGQAETPAPPQDRKHLQWPGGAGVFACPISSQLPHETFPRRTFAEMFRLSPYLLGRIGIFARAMSMIALTLMTAPLLLYHCERPLLGEHSMLPKTRDERYF